MSDIPIGSPPVPPGRHAAPSGWYADPLDAGQERYWDGWQWSRNTRPSEKAPPPAAPQPWGTDQQSSGQQSFGQQSFGQQSSGQPPYPQPPYPQQSYPQQSSPQQPYPHYAQQPYAQHPYPQQTGRKAAFTADGVPLAGWWWRALAIIIDGLITGVVAALIASPIYVAVFGRMGDYFNEVVAAANAGRPAPPQPPMETLITSSENLGIIAITVAVELAYVIAFLRWKSATPGKLAVGLRVVPVDAARTPGPLAWSSILPRAVVWVLGGTTAIFWVLRVIDVLFPLWHPKRQALHDLAARTQVVKIR